jgi:DNA replication protein DnaC
MQKIGEIIETMQLPISTQLLSERLCKCGKPCKVKGAFVYPQCETCWTELAEKERINKIQQQLAEIRQKHRDRAGKLRSNLAKVIPPLFVSAHLRDLSNNLRAIMLNLPDNKGLFIWGTAGVGKSHSMCALMRKFILSGLSVKRVQWDRLCLEIRSTFGGNGSELAVLKPYCDCDRLLIEDVGTTVSINSQETDFSLRTLLLILDDRVEHCKATFITSNKSPEQLGKSFDNRIESRIYASCEIQSVTGKDKRRIKSRNDD